MKNHVTYFQGGKNKQKVGFQLFFLLCTWPRPQSFRKYRWAIPGLGGEGFDQGPIDYKKLDF